MTRNERLRALLKEAREELFSLGESFAESSAAGCDGSAERYAREARHLHARIDAALAEPGDVHPSNLTYVVTLLKDDRDAARAEVERLNALLDGVVGACKHSCNRESHCGVCAIALKGISP